MTKIKSTQTQRCVLYVYGPNPCNIRMTLVDMNKSLILLSSKVNVKYMDQEKPYNVNESSSPKSLCLSYLRHHATNTVLQPVMY